MNRWMRLLIALLSLAVVTFCRWQVRTMQNHSLSLDFSQTKTVQRPEVLEDVPLFEAHLLKSTQSVQNGELILSQVDLEICYLGVLPTGPMEMELVGQVDDTVVNRQALDLTEDPSDGESFHQAFSQISYPVPRDGILSLSVEATDSDGRCYVVPLEQIPLERGRLAENQTGSYLPLPALYDAQGQLLWEGSLASFP